MEETVNACFKPAWPRISKVLFFFPHFLHLLVFYFFWGGGGGVVLFKIRLSLNFMKLLVAEIKYIIQITYIIDVKYKNGIYNK